MNILVTGATGRLGSRFVPHALRRRHRTRILVRDAGKAQQLASLGAEPVTGDLLLPATVSKAVEGIDVVVHLAAHFRQTKDDETIRTTNERGTIALAEAARRACVKRFVFASTNLVYGSKSQRPAREEDERTGSQPYPASKIAAEDALLRMSGEEGFDVRIARFGFVYGAGDPHMAEVLPLMKGWRWHPAQRMHLVHHLDVAQGLMLLAQTDGLAGEAYNVADDAPLTAYEIAVMEGQPDAFAGSEAVLRNPWEGLLDTSKVRRDTGYRPLVPSYYVARELGIL